MRLLNFICVNETKCSPSGRKTDLYYCTSWNKYAANLRMWIRVSKLVIARRQLKTRFSMNPNIDELCVGYIQDYCVMRFTYRTRSIGIPIACDRLYGRAGVQCFTRVLCCHVVSLGVRGLDCTSLCHTAKGFRKLASNLTPRSIPIKLGGRQESQQRAPSVGRMKKRHRPR